MNLINRTGRRLLSIAMLVLCTSCVNHQENKKVAADNLCDPARPDAAASCKWANEMQQRLNAEFINASHYAGQHCRVTLMWNKQGRFAVMRAEGDEPLCLRAWQLVGKATALPAPPNPQQPAWFEFAPVTRQAHPDATDAG
ncbi:cell envelope integrity TolA C-terminal domain-containing protein [Pantoea osteomyelitidis]|uniref:Cell envelope integrity TolA C-terminal domain-containing protein n=1 Tax=Pantoea osteomyelitidis TaxID=3230026 RepID=A0ABW7PTJ8_9GAMM